MAALPPPPLLVPPPPPPRCSAFLFAVPRFFCGSLESSNCAGLQWAVKHKVATRPTPAEASGWPVALQSTPGESRLARCRATDAARLAAATATAASADLPPRNATPRAGMAGATARQLSSIFARFERDKCAFVAAVADAARVEGNAGGEWAGWVPAHLCT